LYRALESILNQTYPYWKVIVVDDASDKNIFEFLKINNILQDNRIIYHKMQTNSGVNIARNYALDIFLEDDSIDYITLLDDDDYFVKDYFTKAIDIIKAKDIKWLVTKCINKNHEDITHIQTTGNLSYLRYLISDGISGDASMMIDKKLLKDIRFTKQYKNGHEWYFFLQLSIKSDMYISNLVSKIVEYQPDGLTYSKTKSKYYGVKQYKKEVFKRLGLNYYAFLYMKYTYLYSKKHTFKYIFKKNIYFLLSKIF